MNKENKNEGEGIIFEDFENRVDVKLSPEIKTSEDYNKSDFILAGLLSWLKSFYVSIYNIRKEIGVKTLLQYPTAPTAKNVVELIFTLNSDKRDLLRIRAKELAKKYSLTNNWEISMEIVTLTHTLLVPARESIKVHLPDYFYPKKPKEIKSLRDVISWMKTRPLAEVNNYPAIYFTRQVTINELKEWIDKNRELIRAIQCKLPRNKNIKRTERAIFWGQVAWILKQDGVYSWAKMERSIEELDEKEPFLKEQEESEVLNPLPTAIELEKYYHRFLESLKTINPL